MKKNRSLFIPMIMVLCCIFMLVGCGSKTEKVPAEEATATAEITEAEAAAFFDRLTNGDQGAYGLLDILENPRYYLGDYMLLGFMELWLGTEIKEYSWEELPGSTLPGNDKEAFLREKSQELDLGEAWETWGSFVAIEKDLVQATLDEVWGGNYLSCQELAADSNFIIDDKGEYLLCYIEGLGGEDNTDYFNVQDITCDGDTATVTANVILSGDYAYDASHITSTHVYDESDVEWYEYKALSKELDYEEDRTFSGLLSKIGCTTQDLGLIEFTLEKDKTGVHFKSFRRKPISEEKTDSKSAANKKSVENSGESYAKNIASEKDSVAVDGDNAGSSSVEGSWNSMVSDRCHMVITALDEGHISVEVDWGASAWENTHWSMKAQWDSETQQFHYSNGICELETYDDATGNTSKENLDSAGSGYIYIKDSMLYWVEYRDESKTEMTETPFERDTY